MNERAVGLITFLSAGLVSGQAVSPASEVVAAINADRERLDRDPLTVSPELSVLAQQRAAEISGEDTLDFEVLPGSELLSRAWDLGWKGVLVQAVTAADDRTPCELVESLNATLGESDVYRRPEMAEVGVGFGLLVDTPVTVVVVGARRSPDPLKRRWPGVAPREYILDDFLRDLNRKRVESGLPSFSRTDELDAVAQQTADELLADTATRDCGTLSVAGGDALYFKRAADQGADYRWAFVHWFSKYRSIVTTHQPRQAGVGIASRGKAGRLEAAWVLVLSPGTP